VQESGQLRARALPYQPIANLTVTGGAVQVALANDGTVTFPFAVYARHPLGLDVTPFDVPAAGTATTTVAADPVTGAYDIEVHGPNGFLAHAAGNALTAPAGVDVQLAVTWSSTRPLLRLTSANQAATPQTLTMTGLRGVTVVTTLGAGVTRTITLDPLATDDGWYDLSVTGTADVGYSRRFAGHLENGEPTRTQ
jgi:phospholipase C